MQTSPAMIQQMFYGFLARYQAAFTDAQAWSDVIATEVPSTTRENRYGWMAKLPRFREWVGDRVVQNVATRAYAVENKSYELTVEVDRDDIEDDNIGIYSSFVDGVGIQAKRWPDDLVQALLQAGITTTCFDGQYFFDTDHPISLSNSAFGTYQNRHAAKPLTETNYEYGRAAFAAVKGEDGRPLGLLPTHLIVEPSLEGIAKKILVASQGANGATNIWSGTSKLIVVPDLANEPGVWYLGDLAKPIKPLIFQKRKAPTFQYFFNPNDRDVFWRKKYVFGGDARGAAGYSLPFLLHRFEPS